MGPIYPEPAAKLNCRGQSQAGTTRDQKRTATTACTTATLRPWHLGSKSSTRTAEQMAGPARPRFVRGHRRPRPLREKSKLP